MYSNISINNTERKEIGIPILKRTDEMIAQFDLDYERYYKIESNLKRDKQFQEFLRLQEQHQFYLKNLIKILKIYFKENNYNSESYFYEFENPINVKNKKRRKKRTKSLRIIKNKYIYYNIIKRAKFYSLYKPYLNPLSDIEKKKLFFIKYKTESNIYKKNRIPKLENTELKLYFNKFGVYPVNFMKKENDKPKKNRAKSSHNFIRSYYYGTRSFDNKTHLLFKKGMIKEKYFGGFDKMKKFIYMKNLKKKNIINLKARSTNRNINNSIKNKFSATKQYMSSNNIYNNKTANYKNFSDIILKGKNDKNNSYMNLNNHQQINKKILQNNNTKYIKISSVNHPSYHIKSAKTSQNKFSQYFYRKINPMDIKNKSINNNNFNRNNNFRKIKNLEYISKFKNEYSATMKKSEMLNHDISFSNNIFSLTKSNYNKAKKVLDENILKKISMVSIIKQDVLEKKRKLLSKFKFIKENSSGNIRLNIIDFIRTPQYRLSYVNDYYKQREQFKKYKQIDSLEQSTEEKNEFNILYDRNKKSKKILEQKDKIIINWKTIKNNKH